MVSSLVKQIAKRQFSVFTMNRLSEVLLNSNISDFKFIPGNLNPADFCTRYTFFSQLRTNKLRFNGSEYTGEEARESIFYIENV